MLVRSSHYLYYALHSASIVIITSAKQYQHKCVLYYPIISQEPLK